MGQYDFYSKVAAYLKKEKKSKPSSAIIMVMPQSRSMAPQDVAPTDSRSYAAQPDMTQPAGVVHPKEGVLSARAMQNIGDDTFTALSHKAEDGTLDLNLLRSAAGLSQLPGYASGGIADTQGTVAAPVIKTPEINAPKITMPGQTATQTVAAPTIQTTATPSIKPQSVAPAGYVPPPTEDSTRTLSTQYLTDVMNNKNPLQKNIATQTLGDLSARQQYSNAALNQTMGQNQNLTEGAKSTLTAEQQAQQSAELAKTEGTLATNAQTQAINAAGTLYSGSLAGQNLDLAKQQFDLTKQQYGDTQQWATYNAALARGDANGAAAAWKTMTGKDADMSVIQAQINTAQSDAKNKTLTTYASQGLSADDAINTMIKNGQATEADRASLTALYNGFKTSSDPISQAVQTINSNPTIYSDSFINGIIPDVEGQPKMTIEQKKAELAGFMVYGPNYLNTVNASSTTSTTPTTTYAITDTEAPANKIDANGAIITAGGSKSLSDGQSVSFQSNQTTSNGTVIPAQKPDGTIITYMQSSIKGPDGLDWKVLTGSDGKKYVTNNNPNSSYNPNDGTSYTLVDKVIDMNDDGVTYTSNAGENPDIAYADFYDKNGLKVSDIIDVKSGTHNYYNVDSATKKKTIYKLENGVLVPTQVIEPGSANRTNQSR